jgi:Nucleoside 2-deoxyribosyltransferase like
MNESIGCTVFLGGACGETTWRADSAIPMLKSAGISYYDPQVPAGQWRDELIDIEAAAKERARHILVVITGETRASASIQEATEYALRGRRGLYLVVHDIPGGTVIGGAEVKGADLEDANRARAYLRSVIRRLRPDVPIYPTVEEAIQAIIDLETGRQSDKSDEIRETIMAAIRLLRRAGTALNLSPADMREMNNAAHNLADAFPEYAGD